jgi:hypothetical protein
MKRIFLTTICMILCLCAYSQVKTYNTVYADDILIVNASDCIDSSLAGYKVWVRYDYKDTKYCKQAAKEDGVSGKAWRCEVLYEFHETLLQYRIISKIYYNKKDKVLKRLNYYDVPWNSVGELDYSRTMGIYISNNFGVTAG